MGDWRNAQGLRIAVLGTGAQGASIGADFLKAGLDVTFIEQWPAHVQAMRENGLTVNLPDETLCVPVHPLHLCEVAEIRRPFDLVFLVVKAYDTPWSSQLIAPVLAPDGLVVGVQNGMTQSAIAAAVGPERTIGCVFDMPSNMFDPGVVTRQNTRDNSWFAIGALGAEADPRLPVIADILRLSGTAEIAPDIRSAKWMKLIVNAAQLVPSAILDLPFPAAAALPGMDALMREAGREAMRAALADGSRPVSILGLPEPRGNDPDAFVDAILDTVSRTFMHPDTLTTILQDWRKGRRAEIHDINGFVVETLARHGQAAPVNARIVEVAQAIEAGAIPAGTENLARLTQGLAVS